MLAREVAALRLQALAVQLVCPAEVPVADRIVENHVGFRPLLGSPRSGLARRYSPRRRRCT